MTSAFELAQSVRAREVSAEEVVRSALDRAHETTPLNIFLSMSKTAIDEARSIDARVRQGEAVGSLAGVPVAIKDNLCIAGTRTTAGSRALEQFTAPYTATVVKRLVDAGAVVLAKTNLDEFAMGSSNENSAFGPVRNPWDPSRVPGGSSGGSAAAVAAGVVPLALGSDTGGSVRLPAAFTGCLGMKPTYGRVSRHGLIAFASSLDQVGPFALTSRDLALALDVICGHDVLDSTSLEKTNGFMAALGEDLKGLRIGVVTEAMGEGNTNSVREAVEAALSVLGELGVEVVDVHLPSLKLGVAAYYLIACPEASSNLARYDGMVYSHRAATSGEASMDEVMMRSRGESFGPEVRRRILMGTYALSSGYYDAYYSRALKIRSLIKKEFDEAFQKADVLVLPTAPSSAFALGEKSDDPMSMYLTDVDTVVVNMAGLPGLSVPFGYDDRGRYSRESGLPLGVQFVAPALEDERLVSIAWALEQATQGAFVRTAPQITAGDLTR